MKDLGDLAHVLANALEEDADIRWNTSDALTRLQLDFDDQSSFYVGSLVAGISTTTHIKHIEAFLPRLAEPYAAEMARRASLHGERGEQRVRAMLAAFTRGLDHPRKR